MYGSGSVRNLLCFTKYFLRPRLDTLMIILGHGVNSLTRLSTKYTTYEAIRDSCVSPSKHFQTVMYVQSTVGYI